MAAIETWETVELLGHIVPMSTSVCRTFHVERPGEVPYLKLNEWVVGHILHIEGRGALEKERLVRTHFVKHNALDAGLPGAATRRARFSQCWNLKSQTRYCAPLPAHQQNAGLRLGGTKIHGWCCTHSQPRGRE